MSLVDPIQDNGTEPEHGAEYEGRLARARAKRLRKRKAFAVWRFVRRLLPWLIVLGVGSAAFLSREFLNGMLVAAQFAARLLFAVMFILIQFVALFWFLAKSKTEVILPGDAKAIDLDDYKGQPKLVELVRQWIRLLVDREKFTDMGGNYINGILLYGPPGTGKTYLAKAMAGEADVAFISIEGSGFRAMFIGIDVLKMIQFTNKAKKLAREWGACVAYIDEIDAVGASRGSVMGGGPEGMGTDHRLIGAINRATLKATGYVYPHVEQMFMGGGMGGGSGALTRLLVAMDGMEEPTNIEKFRNKFLKLFKRPIPARDWHVLYMGATNRPDVLDPALTRPGRFDRLLEVSPPDKAGRREIINYYLQKVKHDGKIDVEAIVNDTNGYTPAQLMSAITKGSIRIAVFDDRNYIKQSDIDRALLEQSGGMENPIEELPEEQRRQIAYHEAGHAVSIYYLAPNRRLTRATIVRHGSALGMVQSVDVDQQYAIPLSDFVTNIRISMAGQAATKLFMGELWTGAAGSDYKRVRGMLWMLAGEGYFGPPVTDPTRTLLAGSYEGEMFDRLWVRIEEFWTETEAEVEAFLTEHKIQVEAVTRALLEHETLMGEELRQIIEIASTDGKARPTVSELPLPDEEDFRKPVGRAAAEPAPDPTPGD